MMSESSTYESPGSVATPGGRELPQPAAARASPAENTNRAERTTRVTVGPPGRQQPTRRATAVAMSTLEKHSTLARPAGESSGRDAPHVTRAAAGPPEIEPTACVRLAPPEGRRGGAPLRPGGRRPRSRRTRRGPRPGCR